MSEIKFPFFIENWDWLEGEIAWGWQEFGIAYIDPAIFLNKEEFEIEMEHRKELMKDIDWNNAAIMLD